MVHAGNLFEANIMANGLSGQLDPAEGTGEWGALNFVARSLMNRINTATLVKIVAFNAEDTDEAIANTVDVQPLVNQIDGEGIAIQHGIVYNVPVMRFQGGVNAVKLTPDEGDIGIAIFASHDISSVKATKDISNPGSFGRFQMSDGLYIGGFLNAEPENYIEFSEAAINIMSAALPINITSAAGEVLVTAGGQINLVAPGGVFANGVFLG